MTPPAPREHRCSFCARSRAELPPEDFLVRSGIGGEPAAICSICISGMCEVADVHRFDPPAAQRLLGALGVYVAARHEDEAA